MPIVDGAARVAKALERCAIPVDERVDPDEAVLRDARLDDGVGPRVVVAVAFRVAGLDPGQQLFGLRLYLRPARWRMASPLRLAKARTPWTPRGCGLLVDGSRRRGSY